MRNESTITTGCFMLELGKVTKTTVLTVNDFVVLCPHSKHRIWLCVIKHKSFCQENIVSFLIGETRSCIYTKSNNFMLQNNLDSRNLCCSRTWKENIIFRFIREFVNWLTHHGIHEYCFPTYKKYFTVTGRITSCHRLCHMLDICCVRWTVITRQRQMFNTGGNILIRQRKSSQIWSKSMIR